MILPSTAITRWVTDAGANSLPRIAQNGSISTIATFAGRDIGGGMLSDAVPTGQAVPTVPDPKRTHACSRD